MSPDSTRVAYLSYHYSNVLNHPDDEISVLHSGQPDLDFAPDEVSLRVVQLSDRKTWNVSLTPSITSNKDLCADTCYVAGFTWVKRDTVLVTWLDIDKQIMILTSCSLEKASCKMVKQNQPKKTF